MTLPLTDIDPREIRCIALDAVGTVLYPDPPVAQVYGQAARRYGSRHTDDEIRRRFRAAFQQVEDEDFGRSDDWTLADQFTTSEDRERRRWERIVSLVLDDPQACFAELFAWFGQPAAWAVYPDVGDALAACAASGYRLALASNFDGRLHSVCNGQPALAPIQHRVISSEVGYRKPSLHFYRALAAAVGVAPERILMVGDDEANDVLGARRAGLRALHLNRRGSPDAITSLTDLLAWVSAR